MIGSMLTVSMISVSRNYAVGISQVCRKLCARPCVGKMAAQERRCKEVGGGHRCHVKSIEFIVRLALGVISIGSITNVVLVYHC